MALVQLMSSPTRTPLRAIHNSAIHRSPYKPAEAFDDVEVRSMTIENMDYDPCSPPRPSFLKVPHWMTPATDRKRIASLPPVVTAVTLLPPVPRGLADEATAAQRTDCKKMGPKSESCIALGTPARLLGVSETLRSGPLPVLRASPSMPALLPSASPELAARLELREKQDEIYEKLTRSLQLPSIGSKRAEKVESKLPTLIKAEPLDAAPSMSSKISRAGFQHPLAKAAKRRTPKGTIDSSQFPMVNIGGAKLDVKRMSKDLNESCKSLKATKFGVDDHPEVANAMREVFRGVQAPLPRVSISEARAAKQCSFPRACDILR